MADQKDLDYTYSLIDKIFRLSLGETGSFSGAMYNGDFAMSLEDAQRRKYEFIADHLNIGAGSRVLDMGCGWGSFLKFIQERGAIGIGLTLSSSQGEACRRNGLNAVLADCRTVHPDTFGTFDAVTCIGAFEAFCSKEEWKMGEQDKVYKDFFKGVCDLLPPGGRFYMQTMVFGINMIDSKDIDIKADKNSNAYMCALMEKQFPGSWLPYGAEQVVRNASLYFDLIYKSSGRLDYIETQKQWRKKFRKFGFKKYLYYCSLLPAFFSNREFRRRVDPFGANANRICFEREIIDHFRFVFEKKEKFLGSLS